MDDRLRGGQRAALVEGMNSVDAPAQEPAAAARLRLSPWVVALTIATIACVAAALLMRHTGDGTNYDFYGQWIGRDAPDFTLTDQNGAPLRLSSLHGDVVLLTFGFTHCPNICPTTMANLAGITSSLPAADQQRVRVCFVTVDPARDRPPQMKDYVGFYSKSFTGLTGSADAIAKVAKDYGAYYEAQLQDSQVAGNYYTIIHSAYVYLIDPNGQFALLYSNDKLSDHARMDADIEHVLGSAQQ
jgi:protein SCO1/2